MEGSYLRTTDNRPSRIIGCEKSSYFAKFGRDNLNILLIFVIKSVGNSVNMLLLCYTVFQTILHLKGNAATIFPHLKGNAATILPHLKGNTTTIQPHRNGDTATIHPHRDEITTTKHPHRVESITIHLHREMSVAMNPRHIVK